MGRLLPCQVRNEQKQSCVDANRLFYVPCTLRFHFFFFFILYFPFFSSVVFLKVPLLCFHLRKKKESIETPKTLLFYCVSRGINGK